ncbi:hypothetical protein [Bacillus chungangensis]|uniref:Membrane protein YGL010W n=1 Tax=Bacillus chungangensis TaxID=587633 RepID=A0ABT9WN27_9BACI|nr:hypothetical protein [Bacillus chungangensis]MDQ0174362.1 putative membrane protein YGL010W [Bacillus chungangensis]
MFEIYDIALIPLILGVVELAKRLGLPTKYSPIVAVVFGLLFGIFYVADGLKDGLIIGLAMGLAASGLYSFGKNVTTKDGSK